MARVKPTRFYRAGKDPVAMTHHEAFEKHQHTAGMTCRICSRAPQEGKDHPAIGICTPCWYKIFIVILIVMIAISYVAWFGVL